MIHSKRYDIVKKQNKKKYNLLICELDRTVNYKNSNAMADKVY